MNHTPTPWKFLVVGDDETGFVASFHKENGENIFNAKFFDNYADDAQFIVQACNSHDELVEALKGLYEQEKRELRIESDDEVRGGIMLKAKEALRKAGVK